MSAWTSADIDAVSAYAKAAPKVSDDAAKERERMRAEGLDPDA